MFMVGSLVLTSWQDTPEEPKIMNELELQELLEQVKAGTIGPDDALNSLRRLPFADLGHAKIDHHRNLRTGAPEAIYGPNKSPEQCVSIVGELLTNGSGPVLLTRATDEQISAVIEAHPDAAVVNATVVWRPADKRANKVVVPQQVQLTSQSPRKHVLCSRHTESTRLVSQMLVLPVYIVFSQASTNSSTPK